MSDTGIEVNRLDAHVYLRATKKFLWDSAQTRRTAVAMGLHDRLGEGSSLGVLPAEILKKIVGYDAPCERVMLLYESFANFLAYGNQSYAPGDTHNMAVVLLDKYLENLERMYSHVIADYIDLKPEWLMPLYGALIAFSEVTDEAYVAPALGIETLSNLIVRLHGNKDNGKDFLFKTIRWSFAHERYVIYTYLQQHMAMFLNGRARPKIWAGTDMEWLKWLDEGKKLAKESVESSETLQILF